MRTIRTKVYKFNELTEQAQFKALCDQIKFETLKMERMKTPWFLAEEMYHNPELKQILINSIEANKYEFTSDGRMI